MLRKGGGGLSPVWKNLFSGIVSTHSHDTKVFQQLNNNNYEGNATYPDDS